MCLRILSVFFVVLGVLPLFVAPAWAFDCSPAYCSKMTTCAEAYYKLEVCWHTKRDGDRDGVPCENLCGKSIEIYLARARAQWPKDTAFIPRRPSGIKQQLLPDAHAAEPVVFSCNRKKRTCKQMLTCEEANFYLRKCGVHRLDGNDDGIPCNSICK